FRTKPNKRLTNFFLAVLPLPKIPIPRENREHIQHADNCENGEHHDKRNSLIQMEIAEYKFSSQI
ncbi:hypothetical protein, partial [Pseudomonas floridensis]|uniref:hypothetical protein n=1 Tax=Pseudomonas floridensis TaxID=1958950 RepID=UPI001ABFA659